MKIIKYRCRSCSLVFASKNDARLCGLAHLSGNAPVTVDDQQIIEKVSQSSSFAARAHPVLKLSKHTRI